MDIGPDGEDPDDLADDTYWVQELYSAAESGDMTDGAELEAKSKGRYVAAECLTPDAAVATEDEVVVFRIRDLQGKWRYFFEVRGGTVALTELADRTYSEDGSPPSNAGVPAIKYVNAVKDSERQTFYAFSVDGSDHAQATTLSGDVGLVLNCDPNVDNTDDTGDAQVSEVTLTWVTESFNVGGAIDWGSRPATSALAVIYEGRVDGADRFHNQDIEFNAFLQASAPEGSVYGICVSVTLSHPLGSATSMAWVPRADPGETYPKLAYLDGMS